MSELDDLKKDLLASSLIGENFLIFFDLPPELQAPMLVAMARLQFVDDEADQEQWIQEKIDAIELIAFDYSFEFLSMLEGMRVVQITKVLEILVSQLMPELSELLLLKTLEAFDKRFPQTISNNIFRLIDKFFQEIGIDEI